MTSSLCKHSRCETGEKITGLICAFLLLGCCVILYALQGFFEAYGFPTAQVLCALPVAFLVWAVSAWTDSPKYATTIDFLASMTFATTVFTGVFFIGSIVKR